MCTFIYSVLYFLFYLYLILFSTCVKTTANDDYVNDDDNHYDAAAFP